MKKWVGIILVVLELGRSRVTPKQRGPEQRWPGLCDGWTELSQITERKGPGKLVALTVSLDIVSVIYSHEPRVPESFAGFRVSQSVFYCDETP